MGGYHKKSFSKNYIPPEWIHWLWFMYRGTFDSELSLRENGLFKYDHFNLLDCSKQLNITKFQIQVLLYYEFPNNNWILSETFSRTTWTALPLLLLQTETNDKSQTEYLRFHNNFKYRIWPNIEEKIEPNFTKCLPEGDVDVTYNP